MPVPLISRADALNASTSALVAVGCMQACEHCSETPANSLEGLHDGAPKDSLLSFMLSTAIKKDARSNGRIRQDVSACVRSANSI